MPEPVTLRQQQLAFAACIRDPQKHKTFYGIAEERLAVYRELFFNNVKETLASAYPVLHQVLPQEQWQVLCEQFFAEHRCHTPYLSRVPEEFLRWLQQQQVNDPPWLLELAQWEWTELDLFLAPDEEDTSTTDDLLNAVPKFSTLARLHHFDYAVHTIGVDHIPEAPAEQSVHLLAWRKPDDDIGFMQLNALSASLLELIRHNQQQTVQELLAMIAEAFDDYAPELIMQGGVDALQSFVSHHIVLLTPTLNEEMKG
ncbi:MAG: DUF2063 domain-containing protein [Gammaproteobacteria bacterium]|nr:MAG: DUF2063 domain-containing protein [Gammaproteobacteria bacterium]